jgi:two-component system LytT family sensor kinase
MNSNTRSIRNYAIGYCLLWLLWVIFHILILTTNGFTLSTALTDSVISNIPLFLFCLVLTNILRVFLPGKNSSRYLIFWVLILAGLWFMLITFITPLVLHYDTAFISFFYNTLLLRFALALFLMGGSILLMWVWQNAKQQKEETLARLQALQLAKDAELASLRQQLQPHFLFNSLNSISALAGSKPQEARMMIQHLSDFLRGTLKKDDTISSTLADELAHLKLYLDIEKVRFGYRLNTVFKIEDECNAMMTPPLILQPIVENAIKFGLYDTIGEVTISIQAEKKGPYLTIEVTNPYDTESAPGSKGVGFGLSSLKRRLFLIYNRHDLLKTRTENKHFITTLTLPQTA